MRERPITGSAADLTIHGWRVALGTSAVGVAAGVLVVAHPGHGDGVQGEQVRCQDCTIAGIGRSCSRASLVKAGFGEPGRAASTGR